MGLTEVMISANVRNWLNDLAIGAKAASIEMMCGVAEKGREFEVKSRTYDQSEVFYDGFITVHIHNIEKVAEAAELDLTVRKLTEKDRYHNVFEFEKFFIFNGVKFNCFNYENEKWEDVNGKENERLESSNSGTYEKTQVDNK